LYGGAGDDVLSGGRGEDALFRRGRAEPAVRRQATATGWTGPGCDLLKQGDGGEDPDGDGWEGVQVAVGNPWLQRLLEDIAPRWRASINLNWVELAFGKSCGHDCNGIWGSCGPPYASLADSFRRSNTGRNMDEHLRRKKIV